MLQKKTDTPMPKRHLLEIRKMHRFHEFAEPFLTAYLPAQKKDGLWAAILNRDYPHILFAIKMNELHGPQI